jgi:hypothetical protein
MISSGEIRRTMKRLLLVALVGCPLALFLSASALAATGDMTGQVFYHPPSGPNVAMPGVKVQLYTQLGNSVVGSPSTTDASGNYKLTAYADGTVGYKIKLLAPVPFSIIAPVSGEYTMIYPTAGGTSSGHNFSVRGSTITGLVFHDRDGDGVKNGSDSNLAGATVSLVGPVNKSVTSAANGTFTTGSPILPAGNYTVTASKTGYDATTAAAMASPTAGTDKALAQGLGLHFGTGTVEGDVYAETNGTPGRQPGEPPIAGVPIAISGTYDSEPFTLNTTSGADGTFSLTGVFAGPNRTIAAEQPSAYADGPEFTGVVGATTGADQFTTVTVAKNASTGRFEFGETGGTITGLTFSDLDSDGLRDAGEPPLGNRGIAVVAPGFEQTTVTSGADGTFSVTGLPGGVDVTLTPKTTSDATAPLAKIVQLSPGGTIGNILFGYLVSGGSDPSLTPAKTVSILAGKRTSVRKSRLSLTCRLDRGAVRKCDFSIRTKAKKGKKGKVLARGTATATGTDAALKVTLKLTGLGKAKLKRSPKSLRGVASVSALDATGQTLTATKPVRLRRL